jgi:flagellar basal body-associated protein FliL
MAEENQEKTSEQEGKDGQDSQSNRKKKEKIKTWCIMGGIVLVFALSGFFLGKVLVETLKPVPIVAAQIAGTSQSQPGAGETDPEQKPVGSGETWFYKKLEAVVANLDEPGATRYVRTTLTLEIFSSLDEKEGRALLESKTPHLRNWLTIYLASLSLDDARGEKNLKRIQSDVLDAFNQKLFPDGQPHIGRILLEDFAIQ